MTAIRDIAETITPGLRSSERVDDLIVVLASLLDRMDAAYAALDGLAEGLSAMLEPEQRLDLERALLALRPGADEAAKRLRRDAERSRTLGSAALDAYIEKLKRDKQGEWIPPKGTGRRPGDKRIPKGTRVVEIDKQTGKVWGQSPDRPADPTKGI